jgi:hypothetical protein
MDEMGTAGRQAKLECLVQQRSGVSRPVRCDREYPQLHPRAGGDEAIVEAVGHVAHLEQVPRSFLVAPERGLQRAGAVVGTKIGGRSGLWLVSPCVDDPRTVRRE